LNSSQQKIDELERLFRGLFDGVPTAVTLRDMSNERLIDCNEAAWRLYGARSRTEMFETTTRSLAPDRQPDGTLSSEALRVHTEIALARGSHRFEWLACRLTGEPLYCEVRISIVELERLRVLQSMVDDIGERRATEQTLRRRAQLDEVLGQVARGFVQRDASDAIQAAVDALGRTLEVSRARVRRLVDGGAAVETTHAWRADPHVPELRVRDVFTESGGRCVQEHLGQGLSLTLPHPGDTYVDPPPLDPAPGALVAPLVVRGALTGWLAFEDLERAREWSVDELALAERVAEIVAIGRARTEAEVSLRKSEERYRSLVERIPDAILTVDRTSRVLFASPAAFDVFGYTPDEWTTTPNLAWNIGLPDTRDGLAQFRESIASGHGLPTGTTRRAWRRKDGRVVYTDSRVSPIDDDGGDYVGVQIILRDVTEQHYGEQAKLRRAKLEEALSGISRSFLGMEPELAIDDALARLGGLLEAERVCVFDPDHESNRLRCTRRWCDAGIDGASESLDAYPPPVGVFTRFSDLEAGAHTSVDPLAGADVEAWITTLEHDSGGRMLYAPIGYAGRIFGIVSAGMGERRAPTEDDVSAVRAVGELLAVGQLRHAAETALAKAKEDAIAASLAKSAFLANMSHELRTPLNGVIGMVDLLATTPLDERQLRYVDVARSSADLLLSVINDVLDFSKIEAGKLEIESISLVFGEIVDDVARILSLSAEEKGIALSCETSDELDGTLLGDPGRIRQVLLNLVSNAIKFTSMGSVTVRASVESECGDMVDIRVDVTDTGIGVPAAAQTKLFSPFTQVDASTTRKHGGSGLGLAICRELVERMGGRIGLVSEATGGSTFWFVLPMPRSDAPPSIDARLDQRRSDPRALGVEGARATDGAAPRVLLVEDSPINALVATEILKGAGYTYSLVADGFAAVAAFERERFDLVLMDCQLPGIDGYEATRRMRALEASNELRERTRVPIVALTASATTGDLEACLAAGMDARVTKPVDAGRLLAMLASRLRPHAAPRVPDVAAPPDAVPRVADLDRALARLRGNRSLFDLVVEEFTVAAAEVRAKLRVAVEQRDAEAAGFASHRLRGQVSMFDAEAVLALIEPFEHAIRQGRFDEAAATLRSIEIELDRLSAFLAAREGAT
jgi:PAS domain S-box-containing protein